MLIYQYKITAILDDSHVIIINLFTESDMENNILEKENYMMNLLDEGLIPEEIEFEKVGTFDSSSKYFQLACQGIMRAVEYPN